MNNFSSEADLAHHINKSKDALIEHLCVLHEAAKVKDAADAKVQAAKRDAKAKSRTSQDACA